MPLGNPGVVTRYCKDFLLVIWKFAFNIELMMISLRFSVTCYGRHSDFKLSFEYHHLESKPIFHNLPIFWTKKKGNNLTINSERFQWLSIPTVQLKMIRLEIKLSTTNITWRALLNLCLVSLNFTHPAEVIKTLK